MTTPPDRLGNRQFRVMLVIHSGVLNDDANFMGSDADNSFYHVVFRTLKYNADAQVRAYKH